MIGALSADALQAIQALHVATLLYSDILLGMEASSAVIKDYVAKQGVEPSKPKADLETDKSLS
jgi:hypothetical protein